MKISQIMNKKCVPDKRLHHQKSTMNKSSKNLNKTLILVVIIYACDHQNRNHPIYKKSMNHLKKEKKARIKKKIVIR